MITPSGSRTSNLPSRTARLGLGGGLVLSLLLVVSNSVARPASPRIAPPLTQVPPGLRAGALATPHLVNLYWDADWDGDIRAAGLPEASLGRAALDGFVRALTQSSYFRGLREYGVEHVEFGGSALTTVECGAKAPVNVPRGAFAALVTCMETAGKLGRTATTDIVVNILLPASTTGIPSKYLAYHAYRCCPPTMPIPFTVAPLHSAQVRSVLPVPNSFGALMTHEIVEAVTNPYGKYGWHDSSVEEGEIADLCPWRSSTTRTPAMPFQLWSVTRYWSTERKMCVFQ